MTSPLTVPTSVSGRAAVHLVCLSWGADLWLRPSQHMSTIQNLRKSLVRNWKPVCSLVGDAVSGLEEGNGNPLQYSCLENPRDGEAWWAAVNGVAQSPTGLKWLSSGSSSHLWGLRLWLAATSLLFSSTAQSFVL